MICFRNASADWVTQAEQKNPEQRSIPDDFIYELELYFGHYSKPPSHGVNDFCCRKTCFSNQLHAFKNRSTCKIILPLVWDINTTPRDKFAVQSRPPYISQKCWPAVFMSWMCSLVSWWCRVDRVLEPYKKIINSLCEIMEHRLFVFFTPRTVCLVSGSTLSCQVFRIEVKGP